MAVSVRIEGSAFSDLRFEMLAIGAGLADSDHALGKMARLWSQCTAEGGSVLNNQLVIRLLGQNGIQALIDSRLGERHDENSMRIRGTKGRIEWHAKLRENGKKGGRPKKIAPKPIGYPIANQRGNPLSIAIAPSLSAALSRSDPPIAPQGVSRSRARKPKPGSATEPEIESVRVILEKLGQHSGVHYAGGAAHTQLIVARLREGLTELDLRKVIVYCAEKLDWKNKPEMQTYLRPETLFGPKSIARYLDAARSWFAEDRR